MSSYDDGYDDGYRDGDRECNCDCEEFPIQPESLYDEMKLGVLKAAYDKYTLEELQAKLDIKNNEY